MAWQDMKLLPEYVQGCHVVDYTDYLKCILTLIHHAIT